MCPFASQYYWKAKGKYHWSFEETSIKIEAECFLNGCLKVQITSSCLSLWYLLGSVSMWKNKTTLWSIKKNISNKIFLYRLIHFFRTSIFWKSWVSVTVLTWKLKIRILEVKFRGKNHKWNSFSFVSRNIAGEVEARYGQNATWCHWCGYYFLFKK